MNSNISVNYKPDLDILYIRLDSTDTSAAFEEYDYVSVFRDWHTHKLTGVDIFGFLANLSNGKLPTLPTEIGAELATLTV